MSSSDESKCLYSKCFYDTTMKWNFSKGEIVSSEVIELINKPVTVPETIQSVSLQSTLLAQVMKHLSMEFHLLSEHIKAKLDEAKRECDSPLKAEKMESMLQQMLFTCTVEAMRSGICQQVFEMGFERVKDRYLEVMKLKNKMADIVRAEEQIKANEANRILSYELLLEKQKVEDLERHLKAATNKLSQLKELTQLKRHASVKPLRIEIPKSPIEPIERSQ
jgi:hypothetical protein